MSTVSLLSRAFRCEKQIQGASVANEIYSSGGAMVAADRWILPLCGASGTTFSTLLILSCFRRQRQWFRAIRVVQSLTGVLRSVAVERWEWNAVGELLRGLSPRRQTPRAHRDRTRSGVRASGSHAISGCCDEAKGSLAEKMAFRRLTPPSARRRRRGTSPYARHRCRAHIRGT